MLELLLCSLLTILPDYLYRRYAQGKRIGKEITLYSVWFELRWGIIACLMLTVGLITVIFYNHPSTSSATLFYRTVPILPETNGRVAEVYVDGVTGEVKQGAPIFRLDSSTQEAAAETARRKIAEVDAAMVVAQGPISLRQKARSRRPGAPISRPWTSWRRNRRSIGAIRAPSPSRDIEKLEVVVQGRQGGIDAATAAKSAAEAQISTLLPAQKASAEAALAQAEVELAQDRRPGRRGRAGGAVHAAGWRHRQPVHAASRRPDPGGRRAKGHHGGLRADRGPGDEGRAWWPRSPASQSPGP